MSVSPPVVLEVNPNKGDPYDRFTVHIRGDVFTGATKVEFGDDIEVLNFLVVDDGNIEAKIEISEDAVSGDRDVSVYRDTDVKPLNNGFTVN